MKTLVKIVVTALLVGAAIAGTSMAASARVQDDGIKINRVQDDG